MLLVKPKIKEMNSKVDVAKVLTNFAKTNELYAKIAETKGKLRAKHLVDLAIHSISDENAYGAFFNKRKKIVSHVDHLSREQVTQLELRAKDSEVQNTLKIKCSENDLIIVTNKEIEAEHIKSLSRQIERFSIADKKPLYFVVATVIVFLLAFVPIRESVTVDGTVLGINGFQVTAKHDTVITDVVVPFGRVKEGTVIAKKRADDELDIKALESELHRVQENIRSSSAYAQEGLSQLYPQERKLKLEIEKAKNDFNNSYVIAPVQGQIEWQKNILGSFIGKGEKIATINPSSQNNVVAYINVKDWINISLGDKAVFIDQRNDEILNGSVASVPTKIEVVNGIPKYLINIKVERGLETGTAGIVSIRGQRTIMLYWLARKPIAWIKANMAL